MTKSLPKVITKKSKRRGRGFGSGRGGHTVGRGTKGQKSRSSLGILFEGVKVKKSLLRRLPLRRGKGKFKARAKPIIVKLSYLNLFPVGSKVDINSLADKGIVSREDAQKLGVKILGDGEIKKRLTIEVPISANASKKIEKAKGKVAKKEHKAPASRGQKPKRKIESSGSGKTKSKKTVKNN